MDSHCTACPLPEPIAPVCHTTREPTRFDAYGTAVSTTRIRAIPAVKTIHGCETETCPSTIRSTAQQSPTIAVHRRGMRARGTCAPYLSNLATVAVGPCSWCGRRSLVSFECANTSRQSHHVALECTPWFRSRARSQDACAPSMSASRSHTCLPQIKHPQALSRSSGWADPFATSHRP